MPSAELPGPWLVVQFLDIWPRERTRDRYPVAVQEALNAHDLVLYDLHPAVEDPDTLLVRCPDLPPEPTMMLSHAADLVARLLKVSSEQAVRIAAYPDLVTAHAAAGDDASGAPAG
jgi:hypothetical protein